MTALLFIHGFASGPKVWELQMNAFSKDFALLPDADKAAGTQSLIIIGWSMGAIAAINLYFKNKTGVKALVLVSAFPKFLKSDDYPFGIEEVLLDRLEKKIKKDFTAGLAYFYRAMFNGRTPHPLAVSIPPAKNTLLNDLGRLRSIDIRASLPKIAVPTLIIHGEKDQISLPGQAAYMKNNIPLSELTVFPDTAHAPFLEKPDEFNTLLRGFINKHA